MRRAGATVGAVWVVNVQLPTGYHVHWRWRHPADTSRDKRAGLLYEVQRPAGLQGVDVARTTAPGRRLLPADWSQGLVLQTSARLDIWRADVADAGASAVNASAAPVRRGQ
jgi:hypothetical protein